MKIVDLKNDWDYCDECGKSASRFVVVSEEGLMAKLCHPCLLKALALVEQGQAGRARGSDPEADEQAGSEGKDLRGPF